MSEAREFRDPPNGKHQFQFILIKLSTRNIGKLPSEVFENLQNPTPSHEAWQSGARFCQNLSPGLEKDRL